jgi:hypothetical protein
VGAAAVGLLEGLKWAWVVPVLASPVVLLAFVFFLLAFQNGYFWETVTTEKGKK